MGEFVSPNLHESCIHPVGCCEDTERCGGSFKHQPDTGDYLMLEERAGGNDPEAPRPLEQEESASADLGPEIVIYPGGLLPFVAISPQRIRRWEEAQQGYEARKAGE